ncbi:(d)CMP kinase [Candidatus Pantoea soli]|uniref:AAA family ATPase n=1 Tax=Candidatus Pantoea soli TaxID=3098669 RepID=A0A518XCH2_9GAMM|nr:(d)CMP kinase [Pantoea soli]QDY41888.1 AAA family ATPase [Pantoea soli]
MHSVPSLASFGPRICILGPSNSGKSTLARAIARQRGFPLIHLDQLYHLPDTHWQAREEAEFRHLHRTAAAGECWVMDGNYVRTLPERLPRATGLILLDIHPARSFLRYLRRTLLDAQRVGGVVPAGQRERLSWEMTRYLLFTAPAHRPRNRQLYASWTQPKLMLASPAALHACYQQWGLSRAP